MSGFNLWWESNDRLGGRVWLGEAELRSIVEEMAAQGMAEAIPVDELTARGAVIRPPALDAALRVASPEPRMLADERLWRDWLAFLEGALQNGGLCVT